jgi:hypothetical protein
MDGGRCRWQAASGRGRATLHFGPASLPPGGAIATFRYLVTTTAATGGDS